MKYLVIFVSFCNLSFSYAQNWFPQGAKWHYDEYHFFPTNTLEDFMRFQISGDSVIQGKNCSRLLKEDQIMCMNRPAIEYLYEENDVVYYYNYTFQELQILYDFSLSPGGSWIVHPYQETTSNDSLSATIDSVEIVSINGEQLKKLYLTYHFFSENNDFNGFEYQAVVLEKIGDLNYLFNFWSSLYFSCDVNGTNGLRCYEDPNFALYETGIAPSCEYQTFLNLSEENLYDIQLYPNPTSGELKITFPQETSGKAIVFDVNGSTIETIEFLDVNQLKYILLKEAGIYFIQFQTQFSINTVRIIKV